MLSVNHLYFKYPEQQRYILNNIVMHIANNSISGIAGHTGSGKSTLLHCIYGKYDALKGTVIFDNKPVTGPSKNLITGHPEMQLVNQYFKLENEISVEENILRKLLGYQKDYAQKRAKQLLQLSGLLKYKNRPPHTLSGGQQQLLSICVALALEPELLLLDEPFSHLDNVTKSYILQALLKLKNHLNFSIIIVSHDATDLLSICNEIHILKSGKLLESGKPEDLYFNARHEYTYCLFGPINHLDKKHFLSKKHKTQFIRPEKLKIVSHGYKVQVKEVYFIGNLYLLKTTDTQGTEILVSTNKKIKNGNIIQIR